MNSDFSELIQYLDDKFAGVSSQLKDLKETKVDKSDYHTKLIAMKSGSTKSPKNSASN